MREVKGRLGILESQYAHLSNRLDRVDGRIERIEQRLTSPKHSPYAAARTAMSVHSNDRS